MTNESSESDFENCERVTGGKHTALQIRATPAIRALAATAFKSSTVPNLAGMKSSNKGIQQPREMSSRLHLLLSGSRHTALNLLAPRWFIQSNVLVAAPLVQLSELLRGRHLRPDDLSGLHDCSSVRALVDNVPRRSHTEPGDEPRRIASHPADEVMVQLHVAADLAFEVAP